MSWNGRISGVAATVGEQEPDPGKQEEVVIDRLELMRQRIDPRDRERELRVVLVREPEVHCLDAESESPGVAIERLAVEETVSCASWAYVRIGSLERPA